MFENLMPLIELMILILLIFVLLLIMIYLFFRFLKIHSLKFKVETIQKGELIKNKFFKTKDLYDLNVNENISMNCEYIILGVHDFKVNKDEFLNFSKYLDNNKKYSYFFYDQRGCGINEKNYDNNQASLLSDLNEIIAELTERYQKKIIIISSGKSSAGVMYFSRDQRIKKIICLSLSLNKPMKSNFSNKIQIFFNYLFSMKKPIIDKYNGFDFCDDKTTAQKLNGIHQLNGQYTVREYMQNKRMLNNLAKNINKSLVEIVIFISNNDFFTTKKNTKKFLYKINAGKINLITLNSQKHYWFWEKNDQNFKKIFENF